MSQRQMPILLALLSMTRGGCGCPVATPLSSSSSPAALRAGLIKHLGGDREPEIVERFAARGATALPALVELLHHPDDQLRRAATRILQRIGPAAEPALAELLSAIHDWRVDSVSGAEILRHLHLPTVWRALWDAAPGPPTGGPHEAPLRSVFFAAVREHLPTVSETLRWAYRHGTSRERRLAEQLLCLDHRDGAECRRALGGR